MYNAGNLHDPCLQKFRRIKRVEQSVDVWCTGGVQKQRPQRGRWSPAFLESKRGAQSLPGDEEPATPVAKNITPSARARHLAGGIAAKRKRSGPRNRNQAGLSGRGAR